MGDGPVLRRPDGLRIFPEVTGRHWHFSGRPGRAGDAEFLVGQFNVDGALDGVEHDDVAVADEADRTADGSFRPDMADAEAARRAREASVRDEGDLVAHALAVERGGRRQHLAHAGPALRTLVADDEDVALLVPAVLHRLETGLLAVEAAGRAAEGLLVRRHAGDLHDRPLGREVAA